MYRLPTRLPAQHPARKWIAAIIIALAASLLAWACGSLPTMGTAVAQADNLLYDGLFHVRTPEDRTTGDLVVLAIDDKALKEMDDETAPLLNRPYGWPWPRETWGMLLEYLEQCGAKAVVFDLLFDQRTTWGADDDQAFGEAASKAKIPVIFATNVNADGSPGVFRPKMTTPPVFGASNYGDERVVREYVPIINGAPSLAVRTAGVHGQAVPDFPPGPFRIHYYGPHQPTKETFTFPYISVGRVVRAAADFRDNGKVTRTAGFDPAQLRGKVIMVGALAAGLYDLKSTPLSKQYPGVEVQATAAENLLHGERVRPASGVLKITMTFGCALLAALGIVLPRQTGLKLGTAMVVLAILLVVAGMLFRGKTIVWLPLATPLLAMAVTTLAAFAWSYLTEGRARQLLFRALSQSLSPEMADEVLRNPGLLARLGGDRREMTVMFTDIAGFTDLSETMEVEKLTELMSYYLEEMSNVVLEGRAYLDKYIGDAIMSFWNGVTDQQDHAVLACRAALQLQQRERDIQPELQARGAKKLLTRIGINSGPMALGNMGSSRKFAFTVLGDSVNLGSRLEGSNKLYGLQILMSKSTADRVRGQFVLRQLDLLAVKGKKIPMPVFELMSEGQPDPATTRRIEWYESALKLHQKQNWDDAEALLRQLLDELPSDAPSLALLERIKKLRAHPPGPDWDGVYVAKEK